MRPRLFIAVLAVVAGPVSAPTQLQRDVSPWVNGGDKESVRTYEEKAVLAGRAAAPSTANTLWYRRPARNWETEALPLGNGWMGAMVFGGVATERVQLNEGSLWTGSDRDQDTGAYQPLGDLFVRFDQGEASDYRRELDLGHGVQRISYTSGGVGFTREYFASYPARVLVFNFTADRPGSCSARVAFQDAHRAPSVVQGNRFTSAGRLPNGLEYETQVAVIVQGGTLSAEDGVLKVAGADGFTVLVTAGTSYEQYDDGYRVAGSPHERVTRTLDDAIAKTGPALRTEHLADYGTLFNRVSCDLGGSPAGVADLPTDERLAAYKVAPIDRGLEALLFQYGRYLLLSSSRPGTLPANLQGKWSISKDPPWRCDYHANINLEMNYWPAEPAALAECHMPLLRFLTSLVPVRRIITQEQIHNRQGWAVRTENNLFGAGSYDWCFPANAWYARHFWEHYAFTQDKVYLRAVAYPFIKEVCQFWEERLKGLPDGTLIAPNGWSPEHGPHEDGITFDQELVHDLFSNYLEAASTLGMDHDYAERIAALRSRLAGPKIGHWGQLQEWMTDRDDPHDDHRHVSHLFALYPGRQISPQTTPDLARAVAVSLAARGDASTGWSMAWKINLWARLLDGDHTHRLIETLLQKGILPNLFDTCPPFQIDGNFGYCAGVTEMLLQSQTRLADGRYQLDLLPALPAAWPEGAVGGLRARGGFEVGLRWTHGQLGAVTIHGLAGTDCVLRYRGKSREVHLPPGGRLELGGSLDPGPGGPLASPSP